MDDDGLLPLSQKQMNRFGSWKRPSELSYAPKMIEVISALSIVQEFVSDCSFVASLCITAGFYLLFTLFIFIFPNTIILFFSFPLSL